MKGISINLNWKKACPLVGCFLTHSARKPKFIAIVWIFALGLESWVLIYNMAYVIDEIVLQNMLLGIIINASVVIVTFLTLEVYKSRYFSGFPYMYAVYLI